MRRVLERRKGMLRLGVSLVVVAALLSQVNLEAIGASLAQLDAGYALLALAAGVVAPLPAAWGWKRLLDAQGLRLSFLSAQLLYAVGLFFATFTPGGIGGDAVRTYSLQQRTGRGLEAGVAVVVSRVVSLLVLLAIVALASLARPGLPTEKLLPLALIAGALGLLGWRLIRLGIGTLTATRFGRWVAPVITRIVQAVGAFRSHPGALIQAAGLMGVYHLLTVLPIFFLIRALGNNVPLADVLALGLLLRLTAYLPISFGGIGIYEAGFVVLFAQVGVGSADALAITVVERIAALAIVLLGGAVYLSGAGFQAAPNRPADTPAPSR